MSQKPERSFLGLGRDSRAAMENQLVAEEAWLMETLRLIKQQRNALRLERIQLEKKSQQLQNINIPELIAQREALMKQVGGDQHASASSEGHSMPTGSKPEAEMNSEFTKDENINVNTEMDDNSSNISSDSSETDENKPLDINILMNTTAKPN